VETGIDRAPVSLHPDPTRPCQDPAMTAPIVPSAEFGLLARAMLIGRGDALATASWLDGRYPQSRAATVSKAAIAAGSLADPQWAGSLGGHRIISASFVETLRSGSAFARMWSDGAIRPIPPATQVIVVTSAGSGASPLEARPKPLTRLSLAGADTEPRKATAQLVTTTELARADASAGLLNIELKSAVAAALDSEFFAIIGAGIAPTPSTGASPGQVAADLRALLTAVNVSGAGKLYFVGNAGMANGFATAVTADGAFAYPSMGPGGGEVLSTAFLVSDSVVAGDLWLVDGAGLCGDLGVVTMSASGQSTLQMDGDPVDGPAALVSLWQSDSIALLAELWFCLKVARAGSVARLSGLDWTP
jgi:hypothetical protein